MKQHRNFIKDEQYFHDLKFSTLLSEPQQKQDRKSEMSIPTLKLKLSGGMNIQSTQHKIYTQFTRVLPQIPQKQKSSVGIEPISHLRLLHQ